jgi:hypothetical protein
MTNVYHDVNGKLMMTHYCAMGIAPKTTPHMHGLVYHWTDTDHLTATWTSANAGKEHEAPSVFSYARIGEGGPAK